MTVPLPPTSAPSQMETTHMIFSGHGKTSGVGRPKRSPSLLGSFTGILHPQYYILTNGYPAYADHPNSESRNMAIDQGSIGRDIRGLSYLFKKLDPEADIKIYCDRKKYSCADENQIRTVLQTPRKLPTAIYLGGHTENTGLTAQNQPTCDRLAYAPADYIEDSPSGQDKLISYETIRQLLLKDPSSAPLLFITETCKCDNYLRLPFLLEFEGNEARWVKTEYHDSFIGNSSDIVHFAATSPEEYALSFPSTGAVFTQALCNIKIDSSKQLSVKDIARQLRGNVGKILKDPTSSGEIRTQRPMIYCSREMDDPDFFKALGFYPSADSNSSVGGDSDSNA
ncbi:ICE-like protease (caspase) p20 domain protein [Rhizoctonia solani AG-3 Rhs1AP]|uniref:ICE-like protease (Caspase) p20 domain protein n=1 Tax=Rhizoctonia solani AG-3 Rhs1AP TaxID=1086054 RepID=X8JKM5_9AGAM|nr:ICE-like protease (caspase) p20 domain protein [Rhizoctonia solani AG-3 Rhs1AP]